MTLIVKTINERYTFWNVQSFFLLENAGMTIQFSDNTPFKEITETVVNIKLQSQNGQ